MRVAIIKRDQIVVDTRYRKDYGDLASMIESFKREGIIQPLAVKETDDSRKFRLLAGGRRLEAADQAGIDVIPVRLYPIDMTDLEMRQVELMENICRKDLTWEEDARLKKEIHNLQVEIHGEKMGSTSPEADGWSMRDTATMLDRSIGGVSMDINLADALDIFPELGEAKNKAEASKMLKKLEEAVLIEELASRVEQRTTVTGLDAIRKRLVDSFIVGDFIEVMEGLPNDAFHLVEVDSPYGVKFDKIQSRTDTGAQEIKKYTEIPDRDYFEFLHVGLTLAWNKMARDSWLVWWFATERFAMVHEVIQSCGFACRPIPGIWAKGAGRVQVPELYLANSYESFFYARKGDALLAKQGRSSVFDFKPVNPAYRRHPVERPIELMEEVIATFCHPNSRILVPFCGSGNTMLAGANLGMQVVGCDIGQEYKDSYTVAVHGGKPTEYKSYRQTVTPEWEVVIA